MRQANKRMALELRRKLHACPEVSGQERETIRQIKTFIESRTSMQVTDCGSFLYGVHREEGAKTTLCFRADMDAIVDSAGRPFHGCGHDGHSAALAGLALELEGRRLGKNVVLLWQPAEENGQGAKLCADLIRREGIREIYGCHNIPGYPAGQILMRPGVFACASRGMIIRLRGKQTHAACPELGISPGSTLGGLLCALPELVGEKMGYRGMVLCSVIGIRMGEKNFGICAGEGEVYLTIRAHYLEDLDYLAENIRRFLEERCARAGLGLEISSQDEFPDTVNDPGLYERMERMLGKDSFHLLEEPMRWSEDFGWYQRACPGLFFGVGAGEAWPGLHTDGYEYNDLVLERTADTFFMLAQGEEMPCHCS